MRKREIFARVRNGENLTFFSSLLRLPQGTQETEFTRNKRGNAIARAEEVMENLRDITLPEKESERYWGEKNAGSSFSRSELYLNYTYNYIYYMRDILIF